MAVDISFTCHVCTMEKGGLMVEEEAGIRRIIKVLKGVGVWVDMISTPEKK